MHRGCPVEVGELKVDIVDRFLHSEDAKLVVLDLVLVELAGVECGIAECRKHGRDTWTVRDLKLVVGYAADETHARPGIDDSGDISKAAILLRSIVDGIEAWERILNAENVLQVFAREEI